jgi:hypothetical protein
VDQVAARLTRAALLGALPGALLGALLGGCAHRPPARVPGSGTAPTPYRTYQVDQPWNEPPGWRLAITGIRCGPAAQVAAGDTDADHVCVVGVAFTNEGDRPRPFSGTADETGPTWRITGYDARGDEFHGHARPVDPTSPGAGGTTALVFEVPADVRLRRVLIATGMVDLPADG